MLLLPAIALADPSRSAPIRHWSGEEPEVRLAFRSLTAMLETAGDWYARRRPGQ